MKNKFTHQVYRLSASILISLIMVILGEKATTNAQNTVNVIVKYPLVSRYKIF